MMRAMPSAIVSSQWVNRAGQWGLVRDLKGSEFQCFWSSLDLFSLSGYGHMDRNNIQRKATRHAGSRIPMCAKEAYRCLEDNGCNLPHVLMEKKKREEVKRQAVKELIFSNKLTFDAQTCPQILTSHMRLKSAFNTKYKVQLGNPRLGSSRISLISSAAVCTLLEKQTSRRT